MQSAALDIWYFSLLPSYKSEESATSLAWLRHAVRVNQTGMELQPMQPVPLSGCVSRIPACYSPRSRLELEDFFCLARWLFI